MDGRAVKVGYEGDQIKICDLFNGSYIADFQKGLEFVCPGGQCLDGPIGKVCQTAIAQKLLDKTLKHAGLFLFTISCFIINALFLNPNCANCGIYGLCAY